MQEHRARNKNWFKIRSKNYKPGTVVFFKNNGKLFTGKIAYRFYTVNGPYKNYATAVLCTDGVVRRIVALLSKEQYDDAIRTQEQVRRTAQ